MHELLEEKIQAKLIIVVYQMQSWALDFHMRKQDREGWRKTPGCDNQHREHSLHPFMVKHLGTKVLANFQFAFFSLISSA